eukprot:47752-Pleurochrysis_carterae.AAC.1
MDNGMMLCLHTTATMASDVLPPFKSYKEIGGRPDEASKSSRARWQTTPSTLSSVQRTSSFARPSGFSQTSSTTKALSNAARRA